MRRSRILIGILVSLVVIAAVAFFSLRYLVTRSFPEDEGTLTTEGLQEPVTIARDQYGIPHITAKNEHDLFFAQGYVHAQDRLFQMDLTRRAGEGRLSQVLGSSTLQFDRMLKTVGFRRIAERLEKHLSAQSKEVLIAYAEGVNAFIRSHKGRYPIEFDMLNYQPEEWTPVHSLMISRLMGWELNISWHVDIVLGELVAKFGQEKASQIFPTYPENGPVIVRSEAVRAAQALFALSDVHEQFKKYFGTDGTHIGSNSWVVAPQRSQSGHAILANDPHLGLSLPAKWYEIHLNGGNMNTAGVSLPGTPLIIIGHTPQIAWGLTNVMADDADFYLEQADSTGERYQFRGEWKEFETIQDTVWVKDSSEVPMTIKRTIHGPVVNSVYPLTSFSSSPCITMRWTGDEISDELLGIYRINTAKNWAGFLAGVREFTVPGQNFLYADKEGNIGYHPGVRLPKRASSNPTVPFNAAAGEGEWQGFIPFDELPFLYNPPEGFIATANNKTSATVPYHISNLWEPPSRIERIREVLRSKERFDVSDFKHLQMDVLSPFAREMTPFILGAFAGQNISDQRLVTVLNYFRNWNFVQSKDDVPTAIFEIFFDHLNRNIYQDEMGPELFHRYIALANVPYRVTPALLKEGTSSWFDDITTPSVEQRDDIVRKSLIGAVQELTERLGPEMKQWRWGRLHTLTLKHPFGDIAALQPIFNIGPFEADGTGTTVNNGEYRFGKPYAMVLGPSMRAITDFADVDGALSVIPSGQSGQPLHEHYADQNALWKNGEYHTLPLSDEAVASRTKKILYLTPHQ